MDNRTVKKLTAGLAVSFAFFFIQVSAQAQSSGELLRPRQMPLKVDKDLGVPALRIGVGKLHQVDVTLVEIPPGGKLPPHRHLAEEMILIISGKGYTTLWNGAESGKQQRFEWTEGDLLSPPLNVWHQHFNPSNMPARYLSMTTAPLTENVFKNVAFLNSNDFTFPDRWNKAVSLKNPERKSICGSDLPYQGTGGRVLWEQYSPTLTICAPA